MIRDRAMTLRTNLATFLLAATVVALAGCTSQPVATISKEGPVPVIQKGESTTTDPSGPTWTVTFPSGPCRT